ncbi:DUF2232 domain-containing protein [Paenibacillus protaetiae]|uniref:DUF2232 domain-containing protein n=1 Tax=Paenibacillus protaetiae TaxID=2509456 RepID=UPI001FC936F0|nr:DUF2232 domain-containing protein [Paenibacillus protaetiae]
MLLLLSLLIPGLNMVTVMFMIVPFTVLYATLSTKAFVLHVVPVLIIAALILGSPALMVGIFFLVPAIVMGNLYRRRTAASKVIVTAVLTMLAMMLIALLGFQLIMDVSLIDQMRDSITTTIDDLHKQNLMPEQWDSDLTDALVRTMVNSIPLTVIMAAFLYAVVTHYAARRALIRSGMDVPAAPPAREWMLPRIMVIYYLIAYVIDLFVPSTSTGFLSVALLNLVPLLRYAFAIQAVGFLFFLAHQRGWRRPVPVILSIIVLIFPPFSLLGVLDAAFPIRKSMTKR